MATKIANLMKICSKRTKEYIRTIEPLEHRIQTVSDVHGRTWVNDSKSSSAQSQHAALATFSGKNIVLIAGGKDKGDRFIDIESHWSDVRHMILMGEMADLLEKKAQSVSIPVSRVDSMSEAVHIAYQQSTQGDVVLLSPGCSSLDMFPGYCCLLYTSDAADD